MPRKRNPVGIAAGKLILAIQKERDQAREGPEVFVAQKVLSRAHTLLQASQSASVTNLLDGRSVVEYLDEVWVTSHPAIGPSIVEFAAAVAAAENG